MRYPQVKSGQWVYPAHGKPYKMACCDCGLVHALYFYIEDDTGQITFQAFRDNRATGQIRRRMKRDHDQ